LRQSKIIQKHKECPPRTAQLNDANADGLVNLVDRSPDSLSRRPPFANYKANIWTCLRP